MCDLPTKALDTSRRFASEFWLDVATTALVNLCLNTLNQTWLTKCSVLCAENPTRSALDISPHPTLLLPSRSTYQLGNASTGLADTRSPNGPYNHLHNHFACERAGVPLATLFSREIKSFAIVHNLGTSFPRLRFGFERPFVSIANILFEATRTWSRRPNLWRHVAEHHSPRPYGKWSVPAPLPYPPRNPAPHSLSCAPTYMF